MDQSIRLGAPTVMPLRPSAAVSARIVTIKGFMEPESFESAADRQLRTLNIDASICVGNRKVFRVRERTVVGFSVTLTKLTPQDSLKVQGEGLGGRRRFGCGLFHPSPGPVAGSEAD